MSCDRYATQVVVSCCCCFSLPLSPGFFFLYPLFATVGLLPFARSAKHVFLVKNLISEKCQTVSSFIIPNESENDDA